jgi:hypothetical protein
VEASIEIIQMDSDGWLWKNTKLVYLFIIAQIKSTVNYFVISTIVPGTGLRSLRYLPAWSGRLGLALDRNPCILDNLGGVKIFPPGVAGGFLIGK